MANPEHVRRLREGVEKWNAWRREGLEFPDLTDVDLRGLRLTSLDLHACLLDGVVLDGAVLDFASFDSSFMIGASMKGASLVWCDFQSAQLTDADLSNSTLDFATFSHSNLEGTCFRKARIGATVFAATDLRNVTGLESLEHMGPSSIGIDTLYRSGGLPESFLRGCGVPEEFIAYASSLVGKAIEYYSCFLSHSSKDHEFTRRLYDALQGRNIRTWYAPEDLKIGDRFRHRIEESIRMHDKLVLILSAHSVASDWVETEVEAAMEREGKEKRDVLFPIAIDDEGFDSQEPWAKDIRRKRHIGDFRAWKQHDDFERAFDRLVSDLRKGTAILYKP